MDNKSKKSKSKGGRPKITDYNNKKSIPIQLYFSPNEIKKIEKYILKNHLNISKKSRFFHSIIIDTIKNENINIVNYTNPKALIDINKLGILLNQLLKRLHSIETIYDEDKKRIHRITTSLEKTYFSFPNHQ